MAGGGATGFPARSLHLDQIWKLDNGNLQTEVYRNGLGKTIIIKASLVLGCVYCLLFLNLTKHQIIIAQARIPISIILGTNFPFSSSPLSILPIRPSRTSKQ
jgi:hypothetical protein